MTGPESAPPPDWRHIDTVLLDLDGTLLDLAFDNHFWLQCLPAELAAVRGWTHEAALGELMQRFQAVHGTLEWYCIDYWNRTLGLDVGALHRREAARVSWLPGAQEFLAQVRARGKRLVLVTNAHPAALQVKEERAGIARRFDAVYSSHQFNAPKEDPAFWAGLRAVEPFDPRRALFVDDTPAVLRAAHEAGIHWIYGVRHPDRSAAPRDTCGLFTVIDGVIDLA
ncbi:MAG: GMP/IMP nucleotidase [Gammaproteobacteria bacterium]|nr:GMP/IMP nucleotidase [Gammaproteobacteria bacterium]